MRSRQQRRGFVLPLVVITIAAATMLLLAAASTSWRNARSAHQALRAARVQMAVESAMAQALEGWAGDQLFALPLDSIATATTVQAGGVTVERTWSRTHPLVAWLHISAWDADARSPSRASANRAMALTPPDLGISATLTTAIAPDSSVNALVQGSGVIDTTDCHQAPSAPIPAASVQPSGTISARLSAAWPMLVQRTTAWTPSPGPSASPLAWRAWQIAPQDTLVNGPVQWQGIVVHDGDLRLTGDITLRGVLVVRGQLQAAQARLLLDGALVVGQGSAAAPASVRLGPASRVRWNRCAVQMALATVAALRSGPFFAWHTVTP